MPSAVLPKPSAKQPAARRSGMRDLTVDHTVQINVRMKASLKEAGDRAWARLGRTPSDMLRALWEYGARNADNPEALRELMALLEGNATNNEMSLYEKRRRAAQEGRRMLDQAYGAFGTSPHVPEDTAERLAYYDELLEEALQERLAERSLL